MDVDVTALRPSVDQVLQLAAIDQGAYICVANVHMCMECFDSPGFCALVNEADLVIPDGKPLSVAQRLLGHKQGSTGTRAGYYECALWVKWREIDQCRVLWRQLRFRS